MHLKLTKMPFWLADSDKLLGNALFDLSSRRVFLPFAQQSHSSLIHSDEKRDHHYSMRPWFPFLGTLKETLFAFVCQLRVVVV
jgi:hypothetical protein